MRARTIKRLLAAKTVRILYRFIRLFISLANLCTAAKVLMHNPCLFVCFFYVFFLHTINQRKVSFYSVRPRLNYNRLYGRLLPVSW